MPSDDSGMQREIGRAPVTFSGQFLSLFPIIPLLIIENGSLFHKLAIFFWTIYLFILCFTLTEDIFSSFLILSHNEPHMMSIRARFISLLLL